MTQTEVLKILSNPTNQAILSLLTVEPTYPRRVGVLLSLSEPEVARRLKHMETLGIVQSNWSHIGKNVKLYKLLINQVSLRFGPDGVHVDLGASGDGALPTITVNLLLESPPSSADHVGRAAELQELASQPVVLVEGMPGIGKTSLLAKFAEQEGTKRPLFWHAFRGVESLGWLANRLAVFLAQHGDRVLLEAVERRADVADLRELLLQKLNDPSFVVVLDDVHRVEDEAVRSFLADAVQRTVKGKLILSSREPARHPGGLSHVRQIRLGGLTDDDTKSFLDAQGVTFDPKLMPQVRDEVGGHPLALHLLVETSRELGVQLKELLDRIPERNLEEYLLQEIDAHLSDEERRVLSLASLFRTRFSTTELAAVAERNPDPTLSKLRRRFLVQAFERDYALHEIVRNFFYSRLQDKPRLHAKVAEIYLSLGTTEGRLEAMHHLLAANKRDRVLALLEENLDLKEFDFIDAGYQNLYLNVLELFKESDVKDAHRWGLIEDEKGDIRFQRGEYQAAMAHYATAVKVFQKPKDAMRLADLAWKRGLALSRLGKTADALTACEDGLTFAPADGRERQRLEELRTTLVPKTTSRKAKATPA